MCLAIAKIFPTFVRECKCKTILFPTCNNFVPKRYTNDANFIVAKWPKYFSSAKQACGFFFQIFLPYVRTWNTMTYHIDGYEIVIFSLKKKLRNPAIWRGVPLYSTLHPT